MGGASGQLGVELMLGLQKRHGPDQVVLSGLRPVLTLTPP